MEKTAVVNLYQVVRMSHYEPSRSVQDDFDTLRLQIQAIRRAPSSLSNWSMTSRASTFA